MMKTKRFLLAAAMMATVAACTADPIAPEATTRRPGTAPPSTSETTTPTTSQPVAEPTGGDGTGQVGSGCCAKG